MAALSSNSDNRACGKVAAARPMISHSAVAMAAPIQTVRKARPRSPAPMLVPTIATSGPPRPNTSGTRRYSMREPVFGLGGPLVAIVGTNIGAGERGRALRTAWIGAAIAAALCEIIGLAAAAFPHAWLSLLDDNAAMLDTGSRYLRTVGPFYGLFGLGMALYFASQGAGRLAWPLSSTYRASK